MSTRDESYLMRKDYRLVHASMWAFTVMLGMVFGFLAPLSFAGLIPWFSPQCAVFGLLAVPVLTATLFSIAMGGARRKDEK